MSEIDPLSKILKEWEAPQPSAALDARTRAAYRAATTPSPWTRLWRMRVSIPVPVLLAAMLLIGAVWSLNVPSTSPTPRSPEVMTRLEATGFQPMPNGTARVEDVRQ